MLKHEEEVFCNFCRNNENVQNDVNLFPKNVSLAMAYVPYQEWKNIYDVENAFRMGTLFADLDKPFFGGGKEWRR